MTRSYILHMFSLFLSISHTHADTHAMHSQLFVKGSRMLAKVETINHRMIICCYRGSQQKPSQQQKILHTQSHKCHMIPPILHWMTFSCWAPCVFCIRSTDLPSFETALWFIYISAVSSCLLPLKEMVAPLGYSRTVFWLWLPTLFSITEVSFNRNNKVQ